MFCLWIVTAETSIASSSRLVCCTATSSDVVEGFSKTVVIVRPTERLVTELSTSEIVSELAVSDEVTYVPVDGVGVTVQMYVNVFAEFPVDLLDSYTTVIPEQDEATDAGPLIITVGLLGLPEEASVIGNCIFVEGFK